MQIDLKPAVVQTTDVAKSVGRAAAGGAGLAAAITLTLVFGKAAYENIFHNGH